MNVRRIALAAVVAWLVSLAVGVFVNDYLFAGMIAANGAALRPVSAITATLPIGLGVLLLTEGTLGEAREPGRKADRDRGPDEG